MRLNSQLVVESLHVVLEDSFSGELAPEESLGSNTESVHLEPSRGFFLAC